MNSLHAMLLGMLLVLAGCNSSPSEYVGQKVAEAAVEGAIENAAEKDGKKVDVDLSDGKMTVKTDQGTATVATGPGVQLPADFPKDVQVPEGATLLMSSVIPEGHTLTFETGTAPADVIAKYSAFMTGQSWTQKASMDMGAQKMVVFEKEGRVANLVLGAASEAGKSTGQLTVIKKK